MAKILKSIVAGLYDHIVVDEIYSGKKDIDPAVTILISTIAQVKTAVSLKKLSMDLI